MPKSIQSRLSELFTGKPQAPQAPLPPLDTTDLIAENVSFTCRLTGKALKEQNIPMRRIVEFEETLRAIHRHSPLSDHGLDPRTVVTRVERPQFAAQPFSLLVSLSLPAKALEEADRAAKRETLRRLIVETVEGQRAVKGGFILATEDRD